MDLEETVWRVAALALLVADAGTSRWAQAAQAPAPAIAASEPASAVLAADASASEVPSAGEHKAPEFPGIRNVPKTDLRALSIGGPRFGTSIHVDMVEQLPEALACSEVLARAQWHQDILLATVPSAHFDNCQFDASARYIADQVHEAERAGDRQDLDGALQALGRALHGIQDFYAHTNYVELSASRSTNLDNVPVLPVWTPNGQQLLNQQVAQGLISGRVWWEPGDTCAQPEMTHAQLNKDEPDTPSGHRLLGTWHASGYQAARTLASQASIEFLRDMFSRESLQGVAARCKWSLAVLTVSDRRQP